LGFGSMLLWGGLAVILTGCGTAGALKSGGQLTALPPEVRLIEATATEAPETTLVHEPDAPVVASAPAMPATEGETNFGPRPDPLPVEVALETPVLLAGPVERIEIGAALQRTDSNDMDEEYDPWEPFNEKMFSLNRGLDRWVLKPVARAYMVVMPEPWQVLISNGFDNINFVPRVINSLLQGKWGGAGRELGRFLINSTAGIGGLFDPAKDYWGIQKSREDFGQTLGVWGSGPGPYLILPLMEPLTVRDGIGKFVDGLMDPLSYVLPFFWTRLGMKVGDTVNDRALNYDLFQGFEESVIDMYSAVRHGYLQRRQQLIKE
jgi:phospholipid-binding lipoprotein MlaA